MINNNNYNNLSNSAKAKYNTLSPIFGESAIEIVTRLEGRGENSFTNVLTKVHAIERANHQTQHYHNALYDAFVLNEEYSSEEIISTVAEIRRDLDMLPYIYSIKKSCERDFLNLFLTEKAYMAILEDEKAKQKHIGYRPIYSLRAEE